MNDPRSDLGFGNGHGRTLPDSDGPGFEDLIPDDGLHALAEQEERVRQFIQSHPLAAIAGALAIGFVFARVMRGANA
jgi:hypothetical protein